MKVRKPALLAATAVLAVTPALTAVAPVQAAPRIPVGAPAAAPDVNAIIEEVLAVLPADIQAYARQILAGDYTQLFLLVEAVFTLPPEQLNAIFGELQVIVTRVIEEIIGGPLPTDPTAPQPDPAAARAPGDPTAVQNKKVAWTLDALLKDAQGQRTAGKLANLIITLSVAAR
ncbi:hypothetical protein LO762_01815 [Actinocorallia sp. API 0066]|uniref:hypothetical protein n=1 Tax=Actinocorallia sp. API 0066 TaxID=2896846 RepID=UPI001E29ED55|nr:hypothetical protein [Actinocorallia sp. API 0066]MCD0447936.1 hypothetical protein [Actinocorallia sp. API 0066]